jgi:hypothetical protein
MPNSGVSSAHVRHQWGPEVRNNPLWAPRVHFEPWKIAPVDKHSSYPPEHTIQSLFEANGS